MTGQHGKILKQAFTLAKGHPTFWRLGLLLSWPMAARAGLLLALAGWAVGRAPSSGLMAGAMANGTPGGVSGWAAAAAVGAGAIAVVMHFRSKAVLLQSVRHLRDHVQLDERVVERAEPYTMELLRSGLAFALASWLAAVIFSAPSMYLSEVGRGTESLVLAGIGLALAVPTLFVLHVTAVFHPMFMSLHGMGRLGALRAAMDMVRRCWPELARFLALAAATELLGMVAGLAAGTAVYAAFVLLFGIFYDMYGLILGVPAQGLAQTLGFMVFFMSLAWVSSFQRIAWTILFLEMARPVQAEEVAESEPLPETVT